MADTVGIAAAPHAAVPAAASRATLAETYARALSQPWLLFIIATIILVARRPATVLIAEFWADDGPLFTQALAGGGSTLADGYAGSFVLAERAIYLTASWLPAYWAPVWANLVSLVLTALVAVFLAVRLPISQPRRLAIAAAFLLLPGSQEVIGTVSHIQWITGAFLLAYPFVPRQRTWELIPLAIAGLTGPLVLLAVPLYVGRWRRDRIAWRPLLVVIGCAVVQLAALLVLRRDHGAIDLSLVPITALQRVTHLPGPLGLLLLALVLVASWSAPRSSFVALWYLVFAIPVAGLLGSTEATSDILAGAAPRYFWLAPGLLAILAIVARPGRIRLATFAMLAVVFLPGFAMIAHPVAGWGETSACIGGAAPCVVPVEPIEDWGDRWSVSWRPSS